MEEMTLEEIKKTEIEILDVIAKFCDERKIKYWIDCGTLLGAIRHKGFIPWDDDIDLGMLRPDYDRFMKEFNGYDSRYEFHCFENDSNWIRAFGRVVDTNTMMKYTDMDYIVHGICVDIFFYDNAPDDDKIVKKMFRKRDFLYRLHFMRLNSVFSPAAGNIFRKIFACASRLILKLIPFPRNYFLKKIVENSRLYVSEDTKRVGQFSGYMPMVCDKDALDSFIDVEFEGKKYKAPVGYDKWLRAFFGDYMQLPPVEQRVRKHNFTAYRKSPGEK